jgi:hypothetical protein
MEGWWWIGDGWFMGDWSRRLWAGGFGSVSSQVMQEGSQRSVECTLPPCD